MQTRDFITVVSGLPRSGTSMMMQMLAAGGLPTMTDNIREADEDNRQGYLELEAVKRTKDDPSWLVNAPGRAVKLIYMLLYDLPGDYKYRVVFMNRSLDEVLASQKAMLLRRGQTGATVTADRMKEIFRTQLQKVRHWLAVQPNFDMLEVEYHQVVADAEAQAARINDFLGSTLDVAAMTAAVTPSLYRQRSGA